MATIKELALATEFEAIWAKYTEYYWEAERISDYRLLYMALLDATPKEDPEGGSMVIAQLGDQPPRFDASIVKPSSERLYSMAGMAVDEDTLRTFSPETILAICLYEATWLFDFESLLEPVDDRFVGFESWHKQAEWKKQHGRKGR